ncbi:alpha/beta hydrolase [Colletotrichum musicola]|uniref:Alpha/beta hydrolase n=1 Tax=Colletotrichum musicola TaxID=2175873 RepID=A0A8H6NWE8_9PEZI|nr:alpha/beta hydrolase [Colletotrichum musicola]
MRSLLSAALLASFAALPILAQNPHHVVDPKVFEGITPSTELEWHDCYTVFKCARMKVHAKVGDPRKPKKVKNKCGQPTVELAIVKLPYVPAPGGPPHQGAVHVSLGGWSSSATNFLVRWGEDYAPLFAGYDLLAIDPRGHGWSTPSFRCFSSEDERRNFFTSEPPLLGADDAAYAAREKRAEEFAKSCKKNGGDVGRFMGTYANAVDHYIVMRADNRTKMGFWGVSAGAHVGQTIAQVYPEVVDKFLFDSPAPSSLAYTVTIAHPSAIKDAERGLDAFFYMCLTSGPANCSFAGTSTTPAQLRTRYTALEAKLKTKPLSVAGLDKKFDWSALHTFTSTALHIPPFLPVLAGVLAEVEVGVAGEAIKGAMATALNQPPVPLPVLTDDPTPDGILSGVCIDEENHLRGKKDFEAYFKTMTDAAPSVAPVFADWRLVCSKWKIEPVNRFDGDCFAKIATQGKLVVVNGIGDPASSVDGAKAVAARFSTSTVVKVLAPGHTSFFSPNSCLFAVFYTFFVMGQMPAEGHVCGDVFVPVFGVQIPPNF